MNVTRAGRVFGDRVSGALLKRPILTGLGLAALVGGALFLGLTLGGAEWERPDRAIVVQVIASAGVIGAALSPALISQSRSQQKMEADVAAVKFEVKNDNSTNLRLENDERYAAQMAGQSVLLKAVQGIQSDIRGIRKDGGRRDDRIGRLEEAVFTVATAVHAPATDEDALGDLIHSIETRETPVQRKDKHD